MALFSWKTIACSAALALVAVSASCAGDGKCRYNSDCPGAYCDNGACKKDCVDAALDCSRGYICNAIAKCELPPGAVVGPDGGVILPGDDAGTVVGPDGSTVADTGTGTDGSAVTPPDSGIDTGVIIPPAKISNARIATYDDHRMAMSFSLAGLKVPGVTILDPGCVAKTYPGYWDDLAKLAGA